MGVFCSSYCSKSALYLGDHANITIQLRECHLTKTVTLVCPTMQMQVYMSILFNDAAGVHLLLVLE